jgi:hypothetical protein
MKYSLEHSKEHGPEIQAAYVNPSSSCMTSRNLFHLTSFSFLICKIKKKTKTNFNMF